MTTKTEPAKKPSTTGLYIVRHYDGFDNDWMDVSKELSWDDALALWKEKTKDGTQNTHYRHIDYYAIFPSDTRMKYSADRP